MRLAERADGGGGGSLTHAQTGDANVTHSFTNHGYFVSVRPFLSLSVGYKQSV